MKLLVDENISYRIINQIKSCYPDSIHVSSIQTGRVSDLDIWQYARDNHFTILTFDADFYEWQLIRGYPPKIIWLRMGNTKTENIGRELMDRLDQIRTFLSDHETGLLEIDKT